jgi:glucose dehydrogenase
MPVIDTDVCIIGGGITAALLAEKLSELRPGLSITIVEAGDGLLDRAARLDARRRALAYGENPWPGDFIPDQTGAEGLIALTMAVGGLALRWGGACNRFSVEDLRLKSLYGLAEDWPLEWEDLEKWYVEAERRLNVFGNPSAYPEDQRSAPYPVAAQPLSYNLELLKRWAERSGTRFDPLPMAHNLTPFDGRGACCLYDTCGQVCPTGARYSPDYTFTKLVASGAPRCTRARSSAASCSTTRATPSPRPMPSTATSPRRPSSIVPGGSFWRRGTPGAHTFSCSRPRRGFPMDLATARGRSAAT